MSSAKTELTRAQERYRLNFDKQLRPKYEELQAWSWVYVRVEDFKTKNPNLSHRPHGSYQVEQTTGHTYLL